MGATSQVDVLLQQALVESAKVNPWGVRVVVTPLQLAGTLTGDERRDFLLKCARKVRELAPAAIGVQDYNAFESNPDACKFHSILAFVIERIASVDDWSPADIEFWTDWGANAWLGYRDAMFASQYLTVVERCPAGQLPEAARTFLRGRIVLQASEHKPDHSWIRRARAVLGDPPSLGLQQGEAWTDAAIADITSLPGSDQSAWIDVIEHCRSTAGAQPSSKWAKVARSRLARLPGGSFGKRVVAWLPLVDRPRTQPRERRNEWEPDYSLLIADGHMEVLKGLCWLAPEAASPDLTRVLGRLALSCYRKVPGIGPRAVKVGNAAVYALGQIPGMDSLGQLAMLRVKVKFGGAQKSIEKALNAAAEREGLPREEIEELGVPTYGLTEVGRRVEVLGDFDAEVIVTGIGETELRFTPRSGAKAGRVMKSVPSAVKKDHADDLKELKAAAKDIGSMLPAQRDRIDGMFLDQKSWAYGVWRERYLDHALVGVLARRLIWRVSDGKGESQRSVAWLDGEGGGGLVTVDGLRAKIDEASCVVRLWHPIDVPVDEVLAWRRFYEDRRIRQPFKQAHREVYLLTDAERRTETYSNRFAAHVIRQHQFHALCGARNWKNALRIMADAEFPPASRRIAAHGFRAEFWVDGIGDDYGSDTNETGTYLHLATDQVRFYNIQAAANTAHSGGGQYGMRAGDVPVNHPLNLERIPAIVLSEVLRDVDLFVGVASVGNNPLWQDGGPNGTFHDYWQHFSFGELSESGKGRHDLLSRLLPRLEIAGKCELKDKYLHVKGSLRTYKIHLGSGNILMEPNDQYLCIVPGGRDEWSAAGHGVFLPFEGDRVLAIILSKAFLLAADEKITDASITRQIGGK